GWSRLTGSGYALVLGETSAGSRRARSARRRARSARCSGLVDLEHVAEAALGLDHGLFGVLVELAAQVRDVGLHDAGVAVEVVLPDVVEDLRLRQHAVGVEHEVAQQLELGWGELDLVVADRDLVRVLVHRELAGAE